MIFKSILILLIILFVIYLFYINKNNLLNIMEKEETNEKSDKIENFEPHLKKEIKSQNKDLTDSSIFLDDNKFLRSYGTSIGTTSNMFTIVDENYHHLE